MKANEAPDKIYVAKATFPDHIDWYGSPINTNRIEESDIEYTRTDAFIEKALAFIRSCTTYDGLGYKAKCVNIEDFKNYMKGE